MRQTDSIVAATRALRPRGLWREVLALAMIALFACAPCPAASSRPLSLERLYSLPWLIGTPPEIPVWSPDSRRIAFLWNDDGTNFHDVWITGVDSATPVRITAMPRPVIPALPAGDVAQLVEVENAERDQGVSAVSWEPDGLHLLLTFHGQMYRVLPGGEPRQLLANAAPQSAAAVAPRAAARPDRVAFISEGELWVADLAGDTTTARRLFASGRADVGVEALYWSSDGASVAFVESDWRRVPDRGIPDYLSDETRLSTIKRAFPGEPSEARRIGIVAAAGGPPQWAALNDPSDQIFSVAWSPNSATLLVDTSDLYIKDRRLLLIDPANGVSRPLMREVDPHNVTAEWWADWAPDGRGVFFISDRDNDYHVYLASLNGGPPKQITAGDWAVFSATVAAPVRTLYFVANAGRPEDRQMLRVPLGGGPPTPVTRSPGNHSPVVSPDGRWLADVYSNDVTPPDLYLIDTRVPRRQQAVRQVTHSPREEFKEFGWIAAHYVEFPNVDDGTMLHARLTLPQGFDASKKYPAILGSVYSNTVHNRWGGRIYHPTWGLDQYLAQQGYVILNVDISGSSGHGKVFRQRIREDYGGVDVQDLYSGVQYLIGQGYVDPRRVGIWGSSYGGLLTTMSLFKHPGVYRAGVAGAPATSLFHAQTGEMRTMMAPLGHEHQYARSSAFLQSGGLRDHLLIVHGMQDDTVLFKDSITLIERLMLQEKDVDLVVLPGSPHGWDTEGLAQTRFAYRKLVDYFRRYLGEGASTDAAEGP